jgi:hypothetical protein
MVLHSMIKVNHEQYGRKFETHLLVVLIHVYGQDNVEEQYGCSVLEYSAVWSLYELTFQRNISPPSSG